MSAASVLALASPAAAEPGDFDYEFGQCGVVFPQGANPRFDTNDFALLPNGKTLEITDASNFVGPHITRYRKNGALDPTFGASGTVVIGGMHTRGDGAAMALAAGGKIVVAVRSGGGPDGALIRLLADGSPDPTFNLGMPMTLVGSDPEDLVVLPDQDIVVIAPYNLVPIARVHADGSPDPSFRTDLVTSVVFPFVLRALPDGSLLVDGQWVTPPTHSREWGVAHFDGLGNPDPSFNFDENLGATALSDYYIDFVGDNQGRIVAIEQPTSGGYAISRHLADGSLDPSFATGGYRVLTSSAQLFGGNPQTEPDGSIDVIETRGPVSNNAFIPVVRRFTPSGQLDSRFGQNGSSGLSIGLTTVGRALRVISHSIEYWGMDNNDDRVSRYKLRMDRLKLGAGLILQWDGTAWPTRFGADAPPQCPFDSPYWPDNDNARGIATVRGKGGYVVDLFGALHPFSVGYQRPEPATALGGPYWPGWDIVRGVAAKRNGTGGYVLDAYGALHPFHTGANPQPASIVGGPYWLGWDITRGVALMPDGNRGYILDGFGGLHRFTTPGHPLPPAVTGNAYWPGWDIARGVGILGDGTGGYIVDAYGGTHPFGIGTHAPPPKPGRGAPYAAGVDWVRGYTFIDPKPVTAPAAATSIGAASTGQPTTDSLDALIANARRRGPTPVGPASP